MHLFLRDPHVLDAHLRMLYTCAVLRRTRHRRHPSGFDSHRNIENAPGYFQVHLNPSENIDVLVIGRSCLDNIAVIERYPRENQKVPLAFRLAEGGGQGGTASCCIARLGGRVVYVGKLGDDEEGRFCLKRLQDFGVDTGFIEIVAGGKTPSAYLFVTKATGARTIIYEPNQLPKIQLDDSLKALLDRAEVALLDPEVTYLSRQLKTHAGEKIQLVYDCERWREGIEAVMSAADFFVASSDFLQSEELNLGEIPLPEKIFQLNRMIAGILVVTHGDKGAYYLNENTLYQVAAPEVKALDTIGAGDNFHGAFALALQKGFDLHRAVRFSVAVASLSCRAYGGRNGLPGMAEALEVADRLEARIVASD